MEQSLLNERYTIENKIGSGGMAFVYKGFDNRLNRTIAIKVLKDELIDDDILKRFEKEARSIANLSHPNIVPIYDIGDDNNKHYIVMEYVNGSSLKDFLDSEKTLPCDDALSIFIKICEAVNHSHSKRIIHRDIKPHNILLTNEEIPKVADFGIAKILTENTMTKTQGTLGSIHYFSPEQAKGLKVDERSDIYSLGITFYEMLTGVVPFDGDNPYTIIHKQVNQSPEPPQILNSSIPTEINNIILKLLEKEPHNRYQNIDLLIDDLNNYLSGKKLSIEAKDETLSPVNFDTTAQTPTFDDTIATTQCNTDHSPTLNQSSSSSQNYNNTSNSLEYNVKNKKVLSVKNITLVLTVFALISASIYTFNRFVLQNNNNPFAKTTSTKTPIPVSPSNTSDNVVLNGTPTQKSNDKQKTSTPSKATTTTNTKTKPPTSKTPTPKPSDNGLNDRLYYPYEKNIVSFKLARSKKMLSISESSDGSYLIYRFGSKDNLELVYPGDTTNSWNKFVYQDEEGEIQLRFTVNDYEYVVYESSGRFGVNAMNLNTSTPKDMPGLAGTKSGSLSSVASKF